MNKKSSQTYLLTLLQWTEESDRGHTLKLSARKLANPNSLLDSPLQLAPSSTGELNCNPLKTSLFAGLAQVGQTWKSTTAFALQVKTGDPPPLLAQQILLIPPTTCCRRQEGVECHGRCSRSAKRTHLSVATAVAGVQERQHALHHLWGAACTPLALPLLFP